MGNCLRRKSATVWAGDDWGSVIDDNAKDRDGGTEKLKLLGEMRGFDWSSDFSSGEHGNRGIGAREMKIRVSKKEMEKLVGMQGLSVEQFLSQMMINGRDHHDIGPQLEHKRSWRPVLQSIPEED